RRDVAVPGFGLAIGDLVNAAVRAIDLSEVVTLAGVGPVGNEDAAVRPVVQGDAAEPCIVGEQEIAAVMGDVAGTVAFENILIDAVAVNIAHENVVAVGIGPVIAEID